MRKSLPYTVITETLDSILANEIDRLESCKESAEPHITDEEYYQLEEFIEQLEAIRGVINV